MQAVDTLNKPVLVYDGECRFCIARVNNIKRLDRHNQFRYVTRQDTATEAIFPEIKSIDLEDGMLLVTADRHIYVGADAVYQIARRLPLTKYVAWLYVLPVCHQIARAVYKWIAANRKKLGKTCEKDQCLL